MPELDVSGDFAIFDWKQDVMYESRIDEETFADPVGAQALKRANRKKTMDGEEQIELPENSAPWEFWTQAMTAAFVPKRGDRFQADGISGVQMWIVLRVDYCDRTTRYRVHAHQEGNGS